MAGFGGFETKFQGDRDGKKIIRSSHSKNTEYFGILDWVKLGTSDLAC